MVLGSTLLQSNAMAPAAWRDHELMSAGMNLRAGPMATAEERSVEVMSDAVTKKLFPGWK
jgi:hypothetical protein